MEEEGNELPIEDPTPNPEEDIFNAIKEQFEKYDGEIATLKKYIRSLAEEIKMLKSNFKILTEELE